MRVLVCGGRNYGDWNTMADVLGRIHQSSRISSLIHGAARGADLMAHEWALTAGIPSIAFPADWKKYPKIAGPIRNQQMIDEGKPELVIAFPGGRGTADMVKRAKRAGLNVREIMREL